MGITFGRQHAERGLAPSMHTADYFFFCFEGLWPQKWRERTKREGKKKGREKTKKEGINKKGKKKRKGNNDKGGKEKD